MPHTLKQPHAIAPTSAASALINDLSEIREIEELEANGRWFLQQAARKRRARLRRLERLAECAGPSIVTGITVLSMLTS